MPGDFPFADRHAFQPSMPTPWLGGNVVRVPSGGDRPNISIAHGLRSVPRFSWVLDAWTNTNVKQPLPRGSTAWDTTCIYVNMPSTTQVVTLMIA